jgi:hypothetical protein
MLRWEARAGCSREGHGWLTPITAVSGRLWFVQPRSRRVWLSAKVGASLGADCAYRAVTRTGLTLPLFASGAISELPIIYRLIL